MKSKIIETKLANPARNNEYNLISDFNSKFPQKDMSFSLTDNKLIVHLRQADLRRLRDVIFSLSQKYHLSDKNIFTDVLGKIESIKSYGLNGHKRLYIDYNRERKVKGRIEKVKKRGSYFYAEENSFSTVNNEFPSKFVNKIICFDSESFLKKLPDNCIDLVFTSPPYNFGLEYSQSEDDFDWRNYFDKLFKIFKQCIRVTKYGGRIVVNIQPLFSDYIPSHHIISSFFINEKMIWKGEILWEKNNYNCKYTAWGSWKSPSNPYLKYTWEFLEIFSKGALKKEGKALNIDITADEFKKWVNAKWQIAPERNMKNYRHPAMFPEELATRVIKLFSYAGDIVMDPFNGAGTTTAVARHLGRRYLGIDISGKYTKIAKERINQTLL